MAINVNIIAQLAAAAAKKMAKIIKPRITPVSVYVGGIKAYLLVAYCAAATAALYERNISSAWRNGAFCGNKCGWRKRGGSIIAASKSSSVTILSDGENNGVSERKMAWQRLKACWHQRSNQKIRKSQAVTSAAALAANSSSGSAYGGKRSRRSCDTRGISITRARA